MTRLWMMHLPFIWLFRYRHSSISKGLLEIRQWQNRYMQEVPAFCFAWNLGKSADQSGIKASQKAFGFFRAT